jgi:hypothetical protein
MSTPIKGEVGIIYIWDATIYRPIACLTSNSLNSTVSVIESQTKCDPGLVKKQAGVFSYTIEAEGEYIDTTSVGGELTKASHDYLLDKQKLKAPVDWKLVTGVTGAIYYGTAILTDLSLSQGAGDEISTFSVTLDGSGDIVEVDPHV